MKLTTLAMSNIKHNMKNYTMYFFAMCFSVFTTYSFANLSVSQTVSEHIVYSQKYQSMFLGFGIAIMVFVLFFLISSNNSFIKYRKKEISTYALFGMENKKIGQLLFFETIIIGIAALAMGILLGIFFSKLMAMVLLKMMLAEYADVAFAIETKAAIITVILYLSVFCLMGLSGYRTINKFQLVDLFKGDRVSEKRTTGSYILLVISIVLIGVGYKMAVSEDSYKVVANMMLVILLTVLGTYLFFLGGLQKILFFIKKNKKALYKKSRLISVSLLSHKARTLSATMGTIAILIATSVTAMAFGYTLYQSAENNAKEVESFDIWYYADDDSIENGIYVIIKENGSQPLNAIKFQRYLSQPETYGMPAEPIWLQQGNFSVMTYSQSTFNEIVKAAQDSNEPVIVASGQALLLYPDYYTQFEYNSPMLKYGDVSLDAVFKQVPNPYTLGGVITVVLCDDDFDKLFDMGYITSGSGGSELWPFVGINYKNALKDKKIANGLTELMESSSDVGMYRIMYNTYIEGMEIFGLICFIGYFICGVFILMSVSLLYFKQISIGTEEVSQFVSLRKIGMDSEQENNVIRRRIAPVFFVPLIVGLLHSVFAMKGADTIIFSNMVAGADNTYLEVLKISSVMYAIYALVYFAFYLITKYKYMRIVGNK